MGILRSEAMKHGTLVLPSDRARSFVNLIGKNGNLQIVDMNSASMKRQYKRYIQRIEEMERMLRFLTTEMEHLPENQVVTNQLDDFLRHDEEYQLDKVEASLKVVYDQFVKFRDNNASLISQKTEMVEEQYVATAASMSMLTGSSVLGDDNDTSALLSEGANDDEQNIMFSNIAGVILYSDQERFARTLFRASRGNTFTYFQPIEQRLYDDRSGNTVEKSVFVVYYQGSSRSAMFEKMSKICMAFGANIYSWPTTAEVAKRRLRELTDSIEDKNRALQAYESFFALEVGTLLSVSRPGGNSLIEEWKLFCLKEKGLYHTLDRFEGDSTLRADCWYAEDQEGVIRNLLIQQSNRQQVSAFLLSSSAPLDRHLHPPTYIRTNDLTSPFQEIVDTYGVPRYREANPALFAIVTFPFLFGIMYGDVGHGGLLFLFGLYLVFYSKKSPSLSSFYPYRYLIAMMGFFAFYAGLIYNDFLSLPIPYKTGWLYKDSHWELQRVQTFGLDPIWVGDPNSILFLNSFKMKFAVIVGVIHMTLGVLLKISNGFHTITTRAKNCVIEGAADVLFEGIPQLIFLLSIFGYMDWMIVYKWLSENGNKPNLINLVIDMCMFKPLEPDTIMYFGQAKVQSILMTIAIIAIPVMLFPKPLILWRLYGKSARNLGYLEASPGGGGNFDLEQAEVTALNPHGGDEEEFEIGETSIHQLIETIEFVLGAISNTASYLRLWALSLAHQQLSEVFFSNAILGPIIMGSPIAVFFGFYVFAACTLGILMGMDVLECLLHAIRLQWVEFQNKFYKGDGYKFTPYEHVRILSEKKED
eukprot:GHVL01037825.1.p1 GENE.GHVL01037825.1~~GHVL01037825.1.p1  ORF type:complete len:812 (-),score=87.46 GHVL01037825.1:737-3172(-)